MLITLLVINLVGGGWLGFLVRFLRSFVVVVVIVASLLCSFVCFLTFCLQVQ